jgi:signal transduction histidine kinase
MKTLSQNTLSHLIFGRITIIIFTQVLVFMYAVMWNRMSAQELDIATMVNLCAIMSCVAMLNAARKGFSSIYQNILILLFDTLYVSLLILISGKSCSPFIILLPLYIFFSTLSLKTIGAIFTTVVSVLLVIGEKLFVLPQACPSMSNTTTASIIILFALLSDHIVRRENNRKKVLINEDKAKASDKAALLDNVVSVLAHEIKNPVSSLAGVSDLIKSDENILNNPDQRQKLLGIIERETTRLANLTEEFLIYSGSEKRRNERVEIDALIQTCCESVRAHKDFIDRNINLSFHSEKGPHITYGDFHRLGQVFTNILINAIQACGNNGEVKCSVTSDDKEITATIFNNGTKIPQHLVSRIFDPFFTTRDKGTGLGLAIAKNIIKAHNGNIQVQSTESETSFKMRFKLWQ